MTDQELKQYCGAVTVPDREIMDAARRRQAELAKPPGSLGACWRSAVWADNFWKEILLCLDYSNK